MANAATKTLPREPRSREWWAEVMARYETRGNECAAKQFAKEEGMPLSALKYRV